MNIFINQPDFYFYQGGNKVGMGYNENQYSLPRWEDLTVSRQVSLIFIVNVELFIECLMSKDCLLSSK